MNKRLIKRIINFIAEIKIYFGAGQGYFMDLKYPFLLAITLKVYLPTFPIYALILLVVLAIISLVILGYLDLKYVKFHQKVQQISTEKYNPYFQNLKRKVSSKNKKFK